MIILILPRCHRQSLIVILQFHDCGTHLCAKTQDAWMAGRAMRRRKEAVLMYRGIKVGADVVVAYTYIK
jgi:hypothetical protein